MTTTTIQDLIDDASAGCETPVRVEIYWDTQDPDNEGPAYRIGDPGEGGQESGTLEFSGWSAGGSATRADAIERQETEPQATELDNLEGYNVSDYFGGDGAYLGPDQHGVYPCLEIASLHPRR